MEQFEEIARRKWKETERTPEEVVDRFENKVQVTEEEILAIERGRELNILVAKCVMNHEVISDEIFGDLERFIDQHGNSVWAALESYSESASAAQFVVNKMIELAHDDAVFQEYYGDGIYTPAEAICRRALLVVLM